MSESSAPLGCLDCGTSGSSTKPVKLTRGRCGRCYQRHRYALKKAGTFTRRTPLPPLERFFARIEPASNGCMHWTGAINSRTGYGTLSVDGRTEYAHRLSHVIHIGPIPQGMHIDHQCHNRDLTCVDDSQCMHRRCVNPDHLEAVTPKANITRSHLSLAGRNARKTHCKRGHEFTPENTIIHARGRACRTCHNEAQREAGARRRAARNAA
jgi:hypothetical protein